jgi:hypothetical protein
MPLAEIVCPVARRPFPVFLKKPLQTCDTPLEPSPAPLRVPGSRLDPGNNGKITRLGVVADQNSTGLKGQAPPALLEELLKN